MNDREVIQRIAAGEQEAFKGLVDLHAPSVLNICHRILRNQQDAEDVAQDVFVSVYRKAGTFRGDSGLSTWLHRIAVNLSLNQLRRRKWDRYWGALSLSDQKGEMAVRALEAPEHRRPDSRLEEKERSEILADVLNTLPERQRVALILHKFEGLSHREVADVLQVSLSSVESLIQRGKENLRKKLTPFLGKM
ncbi:MAG: sigma-70 family RNA polymerase sigma factor [Candidatus Eisenbacteria bacterium]